MSGEQRLWQPGLIQLWERNLLLTCSCKWSTEDAFNSCSTKDLLLVSGAMSRALIYSSGFPRPDEMLSVFIHTPAGLASMKNGSSSLPKEVSSTVPHLKPWLVLGAAATQLRCPEASLEAFGSLQHQVCSGSEEKEREGRPRTGKNFRGRGEGKNKEEKRKGKGKERRRKKRREGEGKGEEKEEKERRRRTRGRQGEVREK